MSDRFTQDVLSSSASGPEKMSKQYPLDLILLGSLNPAVAQMVGLYWVDTTAAQGVIYDYLIVSALSANLGTDFNSAYGWLNQHEFDEVDAYIVFNKSLDQASPPLEPPTGLKVYALPNLPIFSENGVGAPVDKRLQAASRQPPQDKLVALGQSRAPIASRISPYA